MIMRIVLLFALPQEYGCLKRLMGSWRFATRKPFKSFVRQDSFKELVLIETGMGRERMLGALEWLLRRMYSDLVIAAGFAGSLTGGLAVGDACLGEAFASLDATSHSEAEPGICLNISEGLVQFCEEQRIRRTRIVTVDQPVPKQRLGGDYGNGVAIMDMESYFVGRFCYEKNIPFLSFRAISDGLLDEIDFDLATITDTRGKVKIPLVLASVLKSPRLIRSYYHSWKRSMKAARSLGQGLASLINLPPAELSSLTQESRLYLDSTGISFPGCQNKTRINTDKRYG